MYLSKHNIVSKIRGSDNSFIINLLSGNADILSSEEAGELKKGKFKNAKEFLDKGYLISTEDESRLFNTKYLEFLDRRDTDEIQLFFIPNYSCNFNCSYCYQSGYTVQDGLLTRDITDAFFKYVKKEFNTRRKYITLFGGEPLLPAQVQKENLSYFFNKAIVANLEVAFVTNGYHLNEYLPLFQGSKIREIQVTLDGTEKVHDQRRIHKNGEKTFQKITKGINNALESGYQVNLRMVVDEENIENLPALAEFAIKKNWTKLPNFKTQIGRNYELHQCHADNRTLFSRISLYERVYKLIKEHPHILEFHKPALSVSRFLSENGRLPFPLFDSCPGTKTEWAFDYTGKIYSCTATVGKEGEELGTFYPAILHDKEKIAGWEERDIISIKQCNNCAVQLACGGGCAAVAKNRTGVHCSPDCRPVKELLELGLSLYFNQKQNSNERN